jgi:lipoyl(octanoyl) transferase
MLLFTNTRTRDSSDEVWLVEHPAIFTQGHSGKSEHILNPGNIRVVKSDRGGQVSYHGPGQQVMYILIDIKRRRIGVRQLVVRLERAVMRMLNQLSIPSRTYARFPGVYIGYDKVCSIGLRIHRGCSLHGLALNVSMDLSPFLRINPCGYPGLRMTQVSSFRPEITVNDIQVPLVEAFAREMGFKMMKWFTEKH